MSLTNEEARAAWDCAAAAGVETTCPKCGDGLYAHDHGMGNRPEDPDGLPPGAYILCESCGWAWPEKVS